jgi:hypothetical protein
VTSVRTRAPFREKHAKPASLPRSLLHSPRSPSPIPPYPPPKEGEEGRGIGRKGTGGYRKDEILRTPGHFTDLLHLQRDPSPPPPFSTPRPGIGSRQDSLQGTDEQEPSYGRVPGENPCTPSPYPRLMS